jgi:voltage-gated potassium channel
MILNIIKTLLPLLVILLAGVTGYSLIEGWSFFDAFYMTVISLTTVGFGETHPLSDGGKIFTIILILTGVSSVAVLIRNLSLQFFQPFFGDAIRYRKMEQMLKHLKDHYIVCGFGRIGKDVSQNLINAGKPVVIIDKNPPDETDPFTLKHPVIHGDASHEETLIKAKIESAKGLISAVSSEAENVFITMTARGLQPELVIISRFEDDATRHKLIRAGADHVINPYHIGSEKISQIILKPTISKILDFARQRGQFELNIDEFEIPNHNNMIGQSIRECRIRDEYNIIIIAIEKQDGSIITNPGPNYTFQAMDKIVMIANEGELESLFKKYHISRKTARENKKKKSKSSPK